MASTLLSVPSPLDEVDDRDLVERARHDPAAFGALYRRHVDDIHRFAHRGTGSREAAEDVTAQTFEKALRGLDGFRWRRGGFGGWLRRIAANEIAAHHRDRRRHGTDRAQRALGRHTATTTDDPTVDLVGRLEGEQLRAAIATLRPRYQEALLLRFYADLSPAETAAALGVSAGTGKVVLHRAVAALGRAVEAAAFEGAGR